MARKRRTGQHLTAEEEKLAKADFLATFIDTCNVTKACKVAGISRNTLYCVWLLSDDSEFKERWADANEAVNDTIREAILTRGTVGWDEITTKTVTDQLGEKTETTTVHKFDPGLLKFMAQARMPEFKERLDVTTDGHGIGDYEAIAAIADDPDKAEKAADLIKLLAGYSQ